jgi:hypothetical protein
MYLSVKELYEKNKEAFDPVIGRRELLKENYPLSSLDRVHSSDKESETNQINSNLKSRRVLNLEDIDRNRSNRPSLRQKLNFRPENHFQTEEDD